MILYFATKPNSNGNVYYLTLNTDDKTLNTNWNPRLYPIITTKSNIKYIKLIAKKEGYHDEI